LRLLFLSIIVAGDYFGYNHDSNVNINKTNLVDLLEAKGITWKTYQEDYPGGCRPDKTIANYARKHNAFMSFDNIRNNPVRCANIVNSKQLDIDLAAFVSFLTFPLCIGYCQVLLFAWFLLLSSGTLPQFSYYTPNLLNDAHNTGLAYGGKALDAFLGPRINQFPNGTLIVVTWDEDDYLSWNHIYTVRIHIHLQQSKTPTNLFSVKALIGTMVTPGTQDNTSYNHYSLLRTIEDNWNLGNLGRNDVQANTFQCLKAPAAKYN
jgi:hypothetical protein